MQPDGRPHVMPVWGVWDAGSLWFSSSLGSRKARNLDADPRLTVTTDNALEPVVVDGTAERVVALDARSRLHRPHQRQVRHRLPGRLPRPGGQRHLPGHARMGLRPGRGRLRRLPDPVGVRMTQPLEPNRFRREIQLVCNVSSDPSTFFASVRLVLDRNIDSDASSWFTFDPATMLPTSHTDFRAIPAETTTPGSSPTRPPSDDVNRFVDPRPGPAPRRPPHRGHRRQAGDQRPLPRVPPAQRLRSTRCGSPSSATACAGAGSPSTAGRASPPSARPRPRPWAAWSSSWARPCSGPSSRPSSTGRRTAPGRPAWWCWARPTGSTSSRRRPRSGSPGWASSWATPGRRSCRASVYAIASHARRTGAGHFDAGPAVAQAGTGSGDKVDLHAALLESEPQGPVAVIVEPCREPRVAEPIVAAYGLSDEEAAALGQVLRGLPDGGGGGAGGVGAGQGRRRRPRAAGGRRVRRPLRPPGVAPVGADGGSTATRTSSPATSSRASSSPVRSSSRSTLDPAGGPVADDQGGVGGEEPEAE